MVDPRDNAEASASGADSIDHLLRAVREGDGGARDTLCRRLLPKLRRWASSQLPRYARGLVDTDDLAQDAMMRTLGRLETLKLDRRGLAGYLRTAVRNRIRDEIRRVDRRPTAEASSFEAAVADEPSPLEHAIGREALARYEDALDRLEPREREAAILRIEMGFGYGEIARDLGWNSANAARMAVTRALERMARWMSDGSD